MKRGWITRADLVLICCLSLFCLLLFWFLGPKEQGNTVSVYVENELSATFALSDAPHTYVVKTEKGSLTLVFREDGVFATTSDCADAICVRTGMISRCGESIVCVPLGVCVTIEGYGLDGVTG